MMSEPNGAPSRVLGGWQHVPSVVTVISADGETRRAEVRTHQHWAIVVEAEPARIVEWRVMIILRRDIEPYPVVFADASEAKMWTSRRGVALQSDQAAGRDLAADIRWDPPDGDEQVEAEKKEPGSLIFFSDYNGAGTESYTVPVPPGAVSDWPGRKPPASAVPPWTPRSYELTDKADRVNLYGHDHGQPRCHKHKYVEEKGIYNLPFAVLDAATSKY
jgi:hypothetical protein